MFIVNEGNSKLGTSIKVINLPAGITCSENAPCNKSGLCYARKGFFRFPVVKHCYMRNLLSYLHEPEQTEQDIVSQLTTEYCRIHASGDIINMKYFLMLVRIAKKLPDVKFMMFTKKYKLINKYLDANNTIPENMTVIFSLWDGFECDNQYNLPTSQVIMTNGNIDVVNNGFDCKGSCSDCHKCWELKNGENVLFHQH